jgi:hypothetical protein
VVGLLRHSFLLVCPKAILAAAEARHLTQGPPGTIHGRQSGEDDVGTVGNSKNLLALHDAACD